MNKVHWDKIEIIDSVAVGVEMDLHAFAVVKDFSKAKYVIVTNAGKDEKFRYKLFKVKEEPELVYEIDKEKCLSIIYTNPNPDVIIIHDGKEVKKPIVSSAFIKFSFDKDALIPSLNISRDGIENTKLEGEDRHRPRIAKMSDIIE